MNFDKALHILGLTRNYTENELKKKYRELISKWHPDRFQSKSPKEIEKAEEMAKEINAAYDYLKKCLNDQKDRSNQSDTAINKIINDYRIKLKQRLQRIIVEIRQIDDSNESLLRKTKEKILYILTNNNLDSGNTINELNQIYENVKENIKKELIRYTKDYCKKYDIKLLTSFHTITSLKELHIKLEEERKKDYIKKIVYNEAEKYKYYAGYEIITAEIRHIVAILLVKYETKYKDIKDVNIEQIKKEVNQEISKAFDSYFNRLKTLNDLKEKYKDTKDKEIIRMLNLLEEKIDSATTFNMLLNNLKRYTERSIKPLDPSAEDISKEKLKSYKKLLYKELYNNNYIYNDNYYIKKKNKIK